MAEPKHWLMKSEPDVYSIDDLERDGRTYWEGVRNYKARNTMMAMKEGDWVLYYHSRQTPPAVVGLARVVREAYPDHTQFDPEDHYFDAKANRDAPRWFMVDVAYERTFERPVSLPEIKAEPALGDMVLVRQSRLSVQAVTPAEFAKVLEMAGTSST